MSQLVQASGYSLVSVEPFAEHVSVLQWAGKADTELAACLSRETRLASGMGSA